MYTVPTMIHYPTNNIKITMINISFDTHTFSNENKLIIQYMNPRHDGLYVSNDGKQTFRWQKMPRHTAVLIYSMLGKKRNTQKEGRNQQEGERREFSFYFTVLKDVRDTMNLSALSQLHVRKQKKSIVHLFFFV